MEVCRVELLNVFEDDFVTRLDFDPLDEGIIDEISDHTAFLKIYDA